MFLYLLRWAAVVLAAFIVGKMITKIKLPAILGWLIVGIFLGPHALGLMPQELLDAEGYKITVSWMQCAFGVMLGTELVWKKLRSFGKALVVTTLTQSLGTFVVVSLAFSIVFLIAGVPVYLAFVFGGIALATAPAPALSIVKEFHTKGPVTDTLLPMTVLDDVVGIVVFFAVNSLVARRVSGGSASFLVIPAMIFLPVIVGAAAGIPFGFLLKKVGGKAVTLAVTLAGVTVTMAAGWLLNTFALKGVSLNYMLMGVSFAAAFANVVPPERLKEITAAFSPVLAVALLVAIVDLGAPLDFRLILGAGLYTFVYIVSRAVGKYFGAMSGAAVMRMPEPVKRYLGLTLLPHSGVSLVFTGIICSTLSTLPELVGIVQGTIAAAAVINEIIAVIAAKKGFEFAGEIPLKKTTE